MNTVQFTKVAFYDPVADEFYIGDGGFMNQFFGSFEKAKLYVGDRMEILSIFDTVQFRSNRDLIVLDVKVQYEVDTSPGSSFAENTTLQLRNRLKEEFDILNAQAEVDVDLMSQKDWKRWKKLKSELS